VQKGFAVNSKRDGALWYTPTKPEKLFEMIERRREDANRLEHTLMEHLGSLQDLYNPNGKMPKISFYEGVQAAQDLLLNMVDGEGDIVCFGAGDYVHEKYPQMVEDFRRKAHQDKRATRIIRAPKYRDLHEEDPKHVQTRYFKNIDELTVDIQVFQNKMSILSIDKGAPMGVMIEHEDGTGAFRAIFNELWDKLADEQ